MRRITVSVDEATHRHARTRAAELDTSVSALVREFLNRLAAPEAPPEARRGGVGRPLRRRRRLIDRECDSSTRTFSCTPMNSEQDYAGIRVVNPFEGLPPA